MKALSIRQPWAFSILRGGKNIENREWRTRYRGRFLIHASKGCTTAEVDAWRLFIDFADVAGDWLHGIHAGDLHRGGIVGIANLIDCVTAHPSPWFCGTYGFVLADVQPLEFVPCKGALGFFDPDPLAMSAVRAALAVDGLL